jgi:hypothetical protein
MSAHLASKAGSGLGVSQRLRQAWFNEEVDNSAILVFGGDASGSLKASEPRTQAMSTHDFCSFFSSALIRASMSTNSSIWTCVWIKAGGAFDRR